MKKTSVPPLGNADAIDEHEVISRLRISPLLSDLGDDALRNLLPHCRYNAWPAHFLVQRNADDPQRFYVLLEGRLKVQSLNPANSRAITLFLLRPGDGYSLIELFGGRLNNIQIETVDAVETISAPLALWHEWLGAYPALRQAVVRLAGERLGEIITLAEDLALYDAPTRLARLLLRNSDRIGNDLNLFDDLVHEDIAHLIGTVRVVANRLLNRFKQEGIIDSSYGKLRIRDPSLLKRMATDGGSTRDE